MSEFGKWTSVKDGLPLYPKYAFEGYIIQSRHVEEPYSAYWNGAKFVDHNAVPIEYVIAWMPLPEPYKPADPIEEIRKEVENNKSTIGTLAKDFEKLLSDYKDVKEVADGIVRDMGTMNTIIGDLIRHQEEHRVDIARIKMKMEDE